MNIEELLRETLSGMALEEPPPSPARFLAVRRVRSRRGLAVAAAVAVVVLLAGITAVLQATVPRQPATPATRPAKTPIVRGAMMPIAKVWPRAVRTVPEKLPGGPAFEPQLYLADGTLLVMTGKGRSAALWSYGVASGKARRLVGFTPPPRTDFTSPVVAGGGWLVWYTVSWGEIKGALDIWAAPATGGAAHRVSRIEQTMKYGDIDRLQVVGGNVVWSRAIDGGVYQAPVSGGRPQLIQGTRGYHLSEQWPWADPTPPPDDGPTGGPAFTRLVNILTGERRDATVRAGVCSLTWCVGLTASHRDGSGEQTLPARPHSPVMVTRDRFVLLHDQRAGRLSLYDLRTGHVGDLGGHFTIGSRKWAAYLEDARPDTPYLLTYHLGGRQVVVDLAAIR